MPNSNKYKEQKAFLEQLDPTCMRINKGFVPDMNVDGLVYVNDSLRQLLMQELERSCQPHTGGGFLPGVKQIANVAALPGIVGHSIGLPDVHSGYGFAIGNVAAFDTASSEAVVSPGGVGFDINCGVRLVRTNLVESDIDAPLNDRLAQAMFEQIPVGVGRRGPIAICGGDMDAALTSGIDWAVERGFAWPEDRDRCEERGRMRTADAKAVSKRAKARGEAQIGTLGAGNHYAEVQVVDEIYDSAAAKQMGIEQMGQVCVMIHSGSRGFGHQVATDALAEMPAAMKRDQIKVNDRQLACARINSPEGQQYIKAMSAAANFAWLNRASMTRQARDAFAQVFSTTADDLDMNVVYDVSHNIAKFEEHVVDGKRLNVLVHRKGATRAFAPGHALVPSVYRDIGQPVLIGGTMGTCSYVLLGTDGGMRDTFGSTCHGAGRAQSRSQAKRELSSEQVLDRLREQGIAIRVASKNLVQEEAPEAYKDVNDVVDTCHRAGISKKAIRLRPIAVIKG